MTAATKKKGARRFLLTLIKPSHYDDDGYVITWLRSLVPSNSLAAVYALAAAAADAEVLGPGVAFDIDVIDETNLRVDIKGIIRRYRANDNFGLVGLVGVQSNQYPRSLDIARPLRQAGVNVVIGGFHVSGIVAMFPGKLLDLQDALDIGVSLFAGEAENHIGRLLRDAAANTLAPIYDTIADLPGLEGMPTPFMPVHRVKRTLGNFTSFDAGRGCPFQCSFCTIINVQGRKSRRRSPDDVERIIRENLAVGIDRFFITDDNFARNRDWEAIYDRIIELREDHGMDVRFMIQVDTLCHKIPSFIEKSKRAGVTRAFIGLENINPENLMAAKKRQNKIAEYRSMLLAWKRAGIFTYAGYILGFPADTPESIRRDIEIIKQELPLDLLEFFVLTPLPGSEDHQKLFNAGVEMDPDINKYDVEHVVTGHSKMSQAEWQAIYREAWDLYYTDEHIETILRRALSCGISPASLSLVLTWFASSVRLERVHPLQVGIFRRKYRRDRRPGLPIEPIWSFYPRYASELIRANVGLARYWLKINRLRKRIEADPEAMLSYTDLAMTPVREDDDEKLEIFNSEAARVAVRHIRKIEQLTAASGRAGRKGHANSATIS